jgi:hypothetical protein
MSAHYIKFMQEKIISLLKAGIGFDINLFEIISVGELEDHTFYVYDRDTGDEWIFDTAEEAVDYFLKLRSEKELGYDFEFEHAYSY